MKKKDYRITTDNLNKEKSFLMVDYSHLIELKAKFNRIFSGKDLVDYLKKHPPPSCKYKYSSESSFKRELYFIYNYFFKKISS
jgi:hypothetical protein